MSDIDEVFARAFAHVASEMGRGDLDRKAALCCLPIPSLALKTLFQNSGLPLGKIIHLVGEEASFKSTFALELIRWHINAGGAGVVLDTESRPLLDTYKAFFGERPSRFRVVSCTCLEDWEAFLFKYINHLKSNDIMLPVCLVVDSVLGCNSKDTIAKIQQDGFASSRYAIEAKSIADFLRTFVQELMGTPFTLVIINHRKYRVLPGAMMPTKSSLGGGELRFYAAFELELKKQSQHSATVDGRRLYKVHMRTEKNTYGAEKINLVTDIHFGPKSRPDGWPEIFFDWYGATTRLVYDFSNIKPPPSATAAKEIRKLTGLVMRRGGRKGDLFWSDALGVPEKEALPATEMGKVIEENTEIMPRLEALLGVQPRYIYDGSLSWEDNITGAINFDQT